MRDIKILRTTVCVYIYICFFHIFTRSTTYHFRYGTYRRKNATCACMRVVCVFAVESTPSTPSTEYVNSKYYYIYHPGAGRGQARVRRYAPPPIWVNQKRELHFLRTWWTHNPNPNPNAPDNVCIISLFRLFKWNSKCMEYQSL